MKVSSSNYNYYYMQNYQLNSLVNQETSVEASNSAKDESEAASSVIRSGSTKGGYGNIMNLSFSGRMMRDSLQMNGAYSSEMSEKMEKIKSDMESIKTADIDNMTSDEIEEALLNLQTDMESIPRPDGSTNDTEEVDISSMSEDEMRDLLEQIQEDANSTAEMGNGRPPMMGEGMPPMPPAMGALDSQQLLNSISQGLVTDSEDDSSQYSQYNLQQIVDNLVQEYDSSTESSEEYVDKLKESLSAMFSQQKSNIDEFSSLIFNKLDEWSSEEEKAI